MGGYYTVSSCTDDRYRFYIDRYYEDTTYPTTFAQPFSVFVRSAIYTVTITTYGNSYVGLSFYVRVKIHQDDNNKPGSVIDYRDYYMGDHGTVVVLLNFDGLELDAGDYWLSIAERDLQSGSREYDEYLRLGGSVDSGGALYSHNGTTWASFGHDLTHSILGEYLEIKATNPTPVNNAYGVSLNLEYLEWECIEPSAKFNVYFKRASGEEFGFFTQVANEISDKFVYLPDLIAAGTIDELEWGEQYGAGEGYYWRVDTVVDGEVTQGDVWSFSTIPPNVPTPDGMSMQWNEDGEKWELTGTPTGLNFVSTVKRLVAFARNSVWYEV